MKKRLLALLLVGVLMLGLVPAASAATTTGTYKDVAGRWSESYIMNMTRLGLYQGYTDGLFHPLEEMTTSQAISICVRMCGFNTTVYNAAASTYRNEVSGILAGNQYWFTDDLSVAVAAGIVTLDELRALNNTGKLAGPLTREEFSRYLVRAMQLDVPTGSTLYFPDSTSVAAEYRDTVKLLNDMGIVIGDDKGNFNPKNNIKREDSATMFSRAVDYINNYGLLIDLYDFESYNVQAGTVVSYTASTRTLVLKNDLEDEITIALEGSTKIYNGNRLSTAVELTVGRYVRVVSTGKVITAVRAENGTTTTYSGQFVSFKDGQLVLNTGTRNVTLTMDRETVYSAGGNIGGVEVYDKDASYSEVTVVVDPLGRVATVKFDGGTRVENWFLADVDTKAGTITFEGFDGKTHEMKLADKPTYNLPKGYTSITSSNLKGELCEVEISNETEEVVAVTVDTSETYYRGALYGVSASGRIITLYESLSEIGKEEPETEEYDIDKNADVIVNGRASSLSSLASLAKTDKAIFVTLHRTSSKNSDIDLVEAYSTGDEVKGTLSGITLGKTVSLTITYKDGTTETLTFDSNKVPTIKRGETNISVDRLRAGDTVTVTTEFWKITSIVAEATKNSDLIGTIDGVTRTTAGTTVTITLSDGKTESYPLSGTASVTLDKVTADIAKLVGRLAHFTLNNGEIIAVEVDSLESSTSSIKGKIAYIDTDNFILYVNRDDTGTQIRVYVPEHSATIMRGNSRTIDFEDLEVDNAVTIFYSEIVEGNITATIVIVG